MIIEKGLSKQRVCVCVHVRAPMCVCMCVGVVQHVKAVKDMHPSS